MLVKILIDNEMKRRLFICGRVLRKTAGAEAVQTAIIYEFRRGF